MAQDTARSGHASGGGGGGYLHFAVRVTCPVLGGPAGVAGLVERLGTGEKQPFENGDELLRLMCAWSAERFEMRPPPQPPPPEPGATRTNSPRPDVTRSDS